MKCNASKDSKVATTTGVESGDSTGSSKKAKKVTYEKHLEGINKELRSKSTGGSSSSQGKGVKKQKLRPEQEVILLEQKCILLLKLKRHKEVIDDGYSIIGRLGPDTVVYKCILIALVRLGKMEEDIIELLEAWKKATPKCSQMLETKRKFDGYLAALRSGMKHNDIFSGIEDALGLNADNVLSKQFSDLDMEESKWRFRAPPPRHTTFSMCPRATSGSSCIYGDECLFAHSQDELREWKLRIDIDNKKSSILMDEMVEESRSGKKVSRPVPNLYRNLLIPPLCIHYLIDLGKKIKEATDIHETLVDEIAAVKFKIGSALKFQKRIDGVNNVQCTWSFMVGSKMPMGTVSILHDANRELFSISNAQYFNKKKESISLIELHPNNQVQLKLQVLNTFIQPSIFLRFNSGWPDTCYYKVDVTFESQDAFPEPGLYRQSIVFDFKKDPKVVKHVSVEILPKIEPIGNHLESIPHKSPWASPPPPPPLADHSEISKNFNFEQSNLTTCDSLSAKVYQGDMVNNLTHKAVGFKNLEIIDSDSGRSVKLQSIARSGSYDSDASKDDNLFLEDVPLSKENYRAWLYDFLDAEQTARQNAVKQIKTLVNVSFSRSYSPSAECIYKYDCTGELYGKIEMMSDVSLDPKLDNLITNNCTNVLIYTSTDTIAVAFRKTMSRYMCKIVEKSKSAIYIAVGKIAVDELLLLSDSIRQLHVQFVLDTSAIERIKLSIDALSKHHMKLLFPNFDQMKLPCLKIPSSTNLLNEEELFLNSRQQIVYNLITGRIEPDGDPFIPPILLTGGVSTGKSHILAHSIRGILRAQFGAPHLRILICTFSDAAADMYITEYLHKWLVNDELSVQRSKPLRIYDSNRFVDSVCGAVKHYCLFNIDGNTFRYPTREEVLSHRIIIVTVKSCSALLGLGLESESFSHVIIDEAAQCLEAESVLPILLTGKMSRLVICGDVVLTQSQLFSPPRIYPLSLLERLRNMYPFRHPFVINLIENYANHEVILKFISEAFYHDQLRLASNQPCHPRYYPLGFYHISTRADVQADNGGGYYNMDEILGVVEFIDELVRSWPGTWGKVQAKDSLIVATPYINHIMGLRVQFQLKGLQWVNVDLASNLINKKFRVVILSTVRTGKFNEEGSSHMPEDIHNGFFSNRWLVNVAISSAKSLAMVFGDLSSLLQNGDCREIWHKFATECQSHGSLFGFTAKEGLKLESDSSGYQNLSRRETPKLQVGEPKLAARITPAGVGVRSLNQNQGILLLNEKMLHKDSPKSSGTTLSLSQTKSDDEDGNPWNTATLAKAPKTDLFSAFSTEMKPLYSSSPSPLLDMRQEQKVKEYSESLLGHGLSGHNPTSNEASPLSLLLASSTGVSQVYKNNISGLMQPTVVPCKTSNVPLKPLMDICTNPYELATLRPSSSPTEKLTDKSKLTLEDSKKELAGSDLNLIDPQQMPLPIPTIPSQMLFDTKLVIGADRGNLTSRPFDGSNETLGIGSSPCLSPQKLVSPLMRGPPGFAPISYDTKVGSFPSPENKMYTLSPHRSFTGNGKTTYKRNTYELPPRMLKNLHLTMTHRSPIRQKTNPRLAQGSEMNFFEELGLDSQRESCRSASSASSDQSFMDQDETICIVEDESSSLSPQSDWIEVRSTRKGKNQQGKKKSRERRSVDNDDAEENSADLHPEMCVDDKVDIITQMGFTKSEATKALQSCEKDLQRAVDWLISKPTGPGT